MFIIEYGVLVDFDNNAIVIRYLGNNSEVTIPDTITVNKTKYSVISIVNYSFYKCSSLTSITIPNSVTSIDSYTFEYCSHLTIYCEAESEPSGWESDWNPSKRPVFWGV